MDEIQSIENVLDDLEERDLFRDVVPPESKRKESLVGVVETVTPEVANEVSEEKECLAGTSENGSNPPDDLPDNSNDDDVPFFESPEDRTAAAAVINDTFSYLRESDGSPCEFVEILSHRGNNVKTLEVKLKWSNGQISWAPFGLVKKDQPAMLAKYVLKTKIDVDHSGSLARWARATIGALRRAKKSIR